MKIIDDIPWDFDKGLLLKKLQIQPGSDVALEFEELFCKLKACCRPKAVYDVCYVTGREADTVEINDVCFNSSVLRKNLEDVHRVFPYVATCGTEIASFEIPENNALYNFWRDTVKEAALRIALKVLKNQIKEQYNPGKLASMNPGASARDVWALEQQKELFSLLGDVESVAGVRLNNSFLMIPNKSLSGFFFPSELNYENCALCNRGGCYGRQVPYDPVLAAKLLKK